MTHRWVLIDARTNWPVMDFPTKLQAETYRKFSPLKMVLMERSNRYGV